MKISCLCRVLPSLVCSMVILALWDGLAPSRAIAAGRVLYVSTAGNDAWSGAMAEPNAAKTNGPLATLERARDAIRELKKQGGLPEGGVTVTIRGGRYERTGPLELSAEDSGTAKAPIVYRAAEGEHVTISGGKQLTGFQPVTDPAILERLEPPARGKVQQVDLRALGVVDLGQVTGNRVDLYFQDKPMTLSRWPNDGFVTIVGLVGGDPVDVRGTKGDKIGKFQYEGDRPKRWTQENDAWVHGYWFWDWSDQRQKVESIDPEKRIIAVVPPYHGYGYRKGQWFYAFNLLSEIDSPGEWYLDRKSGFLYFWPPASIEAGHPMVSVAPHLLRMKEVSYVTVRGVTLEATRGTAVLIEGGTQSKLAGCTLKNLGESAVSINGGTHNGVLSCDIYQTGGGGIALSGGDRAKLAPASHFAENNHIHHYGLWNRMYQTAVALNGVGQHVAHNLIHDAPHIAIVFGGNDHGIELNEIHHVCLESNDAGAIYAGRDWSMRGTAIRHNYLHDIRGFRDQGCVGVYLDDMFSGTTIFGNVFYNVTRPAFIGGGRDNTVENNLFVDCRPALHIDGRALNWAGYHVNTTMTDTLKAMPYQTPPWSQRYPRLVGILQDEPAAPKGNLVARNVSFGGQWDGVGSDARRYVTFQDNLVDQDPHLVDAAAKDFRLKDDSPVYRKVPGFQKIPFEQMGLRCDEYRKK